MNQQQQMGAHGQTTLQIQQEMARLREANRNRPGIPIGQQFTPLIHAQGRRTHEKSSASQDQDGGGRVFGPKEPANMAQTTTDVPTGPTIVDQSPFLMQTNPVRGFAPLPAIGFPNLAVGPCPTFTPATFQNWKREIKLWISGQRGASITKLLAKLIHVLPLDVKN